MRRRVSAISGAGNRLADAGDADFGSIPDVAYFKVYATASNLRYACPITRLSRAASTTSLPTLVNLLISVMRSI
jgi:hypothetical protein